MSLLLLMRFLLPMMTAARAVRAPRELTTVKMAGIMRPRMPGTDTFIHLYLFLLSVIFFHNIETMVSHRYVYSLFLI